MPSSGLPPNSVIYLSPGLRFTPPCGNTTTFSAVVRPVSYAFKSVRDNNLGSSSPEVKLFCIAITLDITLPQLNQSYCCLVFALFVLVRLLDMLV